MNKDESNGNDYISLSQPEPEDNNGSDLEPSNQYSERTFYKRLRLFLLERKLAITFRIIGIIGLGFKIYAIFKKFWRGHLEWGLVSIILLILTGVAGSIYSLYCEVIEKRGLGFEYREESEAEQLELLHKDDDGFAGDKVLEVQLSDEEETHSVVADESSTTVHAPEADDIEPVADNENSSSYQDQSKNENSIASGKYKKLKSAALKAIPLHRISSKKKKKLQNQISAQSGNSFHGTYMEPSFKRQQDIPLKEFLPGVMEYCKLEMKLSHILPIPQLPQLYHFCRTSYILWEHYSEPYHKAACAALKESGVQEACFRPYLLKYCRRKIISKQISLLMATVQTIPMIFIELLYYSVKSSAIFNLPENEKANFWTYGGPQFDIFELAALVANIVNISYRIVSLMGQIRKVNVLKQNMKMIHKVYLTVMYSLLLLSRLASIYLVMCLNYNGAFFAGFVLVNQFVIVFVVSFNLTVKGAREELTHEDEGENIISTVLSNIFMLFLYLPPEKGKRVSMFGYELMMGFEMLAMFAFGVFQLHDDKDLADNFIIAGHNLPGTEYFYYIYIGLLLIFVCSCFCSSEIVQRCMFVYKNETSFQYIQSKLNEANRRYGTKYKIEATDQSTNIMISRHSIVI